MMWKGVAAVAALLLVLTGVYTHGRDTGRLEGKLSYTELERDLGQARAEAKEAKETKQQELAALTEKLNDEHAQAMGNLQLDAATSRAESDGMRGQLADLQNRLRRLQPSDSTTGFQPSAGTRAAMVLSDLLGSCSAERSELAEAFDGARQRGLALEAQYTAVRGQ